MVTALQLARELREEAREHGFGWLFDAVLDRVARSYPEIRPALDEPRRVYLTARHVLEDELERKGAA